VTDSIDPRKAAFIVPEPTRPKQTSYGTNQKKARLKPYPRLV